jgi:DNA polymerase III subunit delta
MIDPVYLLLGPESGAKSVFVQEVREGLQKAHGSDLEVTRAFASTDELSDLLSALRSPGLFSSHMLMILYQAEAVFTAKALQEYIADPSEGATLLLLSEETRTPPTLEKIAKKHLSEKARKVFWEMFEDQKERWVHAAFSRRNLRVEDDAVRLLLDLADNTTSSLEMQIERIARTVDRSTVITEEILEEVLDHTKEESPFGLFDSIVDDKLTKALEDLERLLLQSDTSTTQITAALSWQYRRLALVSELSSRGVSDNEAFGQLQIRGKRNQALFRKALHRLSGTQIQAGLALIPEYEARLRSTPVALHRGLLQELIYLLLLRRPAKEMLAEPVY